MRLLSRFPFLVSVCATFFALSTPGEARSREANLLDFGPPIEAPRGFAAMCLGDRGLCFVSQGQAGGAGLTSKATLTEAWARSYRPSFALSSRYPWATAEIIVPFWLSRQPQHPIAEANAPGLGPPSSSPAPRESARAQYALLKRINLLVNRNVQQRSDIATHQTDELWQRSGIGPDAVGDCEDIAIEKRIRLIEAGFEPADLSFAIVYSRESGLHTLLIARVQDRGDVVLDSRRDQIVSWRKAPYRWIGVQSSTDPMAWYSVTNADS